MAWWWPRANDPPEIVAEAEVDIAEGFEGRADPRSSDALEGRAYALGLGLRGRTAIRSCDEGLWQSVKGAGFGSDRFTIHLPFGAIDLRKPDPKREPSVLIYQTALCGALLDERRHINSSRWGALLAEMPTRFDTPLFWTEAEHAALHASVMGVSRQLVSHHELEAVPTRLSHFQGGGLTPLPDRVEAPALQSRPSTGMSICVTAPSCRAARRRPSTAR